MKLIIMTKSTFFVEEDKILTALFDEGLDNLHLYKPGASPMYSERLLTLLPDECYNRITVHEHFYLKEEYGLRGIHIDDATTPAPERYRGRMCRTVGLDDNIKEAKRKCDYVFLRNVFADSDNEAGVSLAEIQEASRKGLIDKKTYAWGGVNLDNIKKARDFGFGGVVVCDDLWDKFDIHNQLDYKELISHYEKLRKAVN